MSDVLSRLAATVRAQGGLLAEAGAGAPSATHASAPHGALAAAGPRAAADPDRYELLVEAIREGYLLHYCEARVVTPSDPDLALLVGDQLYALGLAELATLGDLEAVRELADVISLAAQAQAAADEELAEAVWDAGATAVGWGATPAHEEAKAQARAGAPQAAVELRDAARHARGDGAPRR
jgi:hypothetical protein